MTASTQPQQTGSQSSTGKDQWAELSKHYSTMTCHPTAPTLLELLHHADQLLPFEQATSTLDVSCGPGLVTKSLLTEYATKLNLIAPSNEFHASDFSPAMIVQVEKLKSERLGQGDVNWAKVETSVDDAQNLARFADGSMSHVLGGFVYMLLPDPAKGIAAAHRVLQAGGVVCLSA